MALRVFIVAVISLPVSTVHCKISSLVFTWDFLLAFVVVFILFLATKVWSLFSYIFLQLHCYKLSLYFLFPLKQKQKKKFFSSLQNDVTLNVAIITTIMCLDKMLLYCVVAHKLASCYCCCMLLLLLLLLYVLPF